MDHEQQTMDNSELKTGTVENNICSNLSLFDNNTMDHILI